MTNRKADRKKKATQIAALVIAGIMGLSVLLAAVIH